MKKLLLVTAISILGLAHVNAQEVKFGVKGGLNFASVIGAESSQLEPITAFHFGGMAEIFISEKFSLQPELMYSGQGFSDGGIIDLHYLNVPLMAKYYVAKRISLEAGPQIGFLLNAREGGENLKDHDNNVDLGVNFGLGYKLDNGLNFGMRYNLGLTDLSVTDNYSKATNKIKNGVFQFSIGYFF
jgi:hypothetical protein